MPARGVARRWRERELAGDERAGRWARGKARRKQRDFVRRNWRILVGVGGGMLVAVGVLAPVVPSPFARGLYLGSFGTAIIGLMAFWVVQATGTAPTMMGDEAEQWTAQELRKLRARGWKLINHISLRGWDIDHVLVGPGGAFTIETKWTADAWKPVEHDDRVRAACDQAVQNARTVRLWLKRAELGVVEPVIFLWGSGARDLPAVQFEESDGHVATVVAGPAARSWAAALPAEGLDGRQVERAWSLIEQYCTGRDPREAVEAPLPLSVGQMAMRGFLAVLAANVAFLTFATWLEYEPAARWWVPALLILSLPAILLLRQIRAVRYIAWGWLGGVAVSVVLILYALARSVLG